MTRYDHIKFPEYVYHEYPKWVGGVIVSNAEEERALGVEDDLPKTAIAESETAIAVIPERTKRQYNRKAK